MNNLKVETINPHKNLNRVKELLTQLNPEKCEKYIGLILEQMQTFQNFTCFGLYEKNRIIGIASGWTSMRVYCGKQLELDNVIIDNNLQSKGLRNLFFKKIENWALQNDYKSLNLSTYVSNSRSHKFYFNQGFNILGFHFQKLIQ